LKIAYFILNSFDFDSRARLEVETLGDMGHHVEIIATAGADSVSFNRFPIHRIAQWNHPTRKFRFLQYNMTAARIGRRLRADVYHAVDLDVLQAAVRSAGKAKIVYESRELYTELEALSGRPAIKAVWRGLEGRLIGKADKVITINESIAAELSKRYGIGKPVVIRNAAPLPQNIKPVDLHSKFNIPADWKILIYQGVLRRGQGLPYLLEIVSCLENMALLLVGSGPLESELKDRAASSNLADKIRFAGRVPPDELANYTAAAAAGLLFMEDVSLNNRLALPQKLFQYLAAGIPQIVSPMPELASFVETEGTGLVTPPGDPKTAAGLISDFLCNERNYRQARANCASSASRNNWALESLKLRKVYEDLEPGV
jgi:glycosyltransferase involved in cell wall biosynthesis